MWDDDVVFSFGNFSCSQQTFTRACKHTRVIRSKIFSDGKSVYPWRIRRGENNRSRYARTLKTWYARHVHVRTIYVDKVCKNCRKKNYSSVLKYLTRASRILLSRTIERFTLKNNFLEWSHTINPYKAIAGSSDKNVSALYTSYEQVCTCRIIYSTKPIIGIARDVINQIIEHTSTIYNKINYFIYYYDEIQKIINFVLMNVSFKKYFIHFK